MTDQLRLGATFEDKATPGIKKLKKEIADVKATPGMESVLGWTSKLTKEAEGFITKGGGAAGVISAMGIGGLTAAASLAGLTAQMRELGNQKLALKELGREIGMSATEIDRFTKSGQHFQVTIDDMKGLLNDFAGQTVDLQRGTGHLNEELTQFPKTLAKMRAELGKGHFAEALMDGLEQAEAIGKSKGPQAQKEFLESLFPGGGAIAEKLFGDGGLAGFQKQLEKMKLQIEPINPELTKQAQKFLDAQIGLNNAIGNFENKVGPKFLELMTHIVDDMRYLLGGITPEEQAKLDKKQADDRAAFQAKQKERSDDAARTQRAGGAKDERDANALTKEEQARIDRALKTPPSYTPGSVAPNTGLLHHTAYGLGTRPAGATPGGGLGNTEVIETIAAGTKIGFIAAYRDLANGTDGAAANGISNAAFHPGGGMGGGRSYGGGSGSGNFTDSGAGAGKGGGPLPGKRADLALRYMRRLVEQHGFTPEAAAIAAGNAEEESGWRPGIGGDGGMSHGLHQWNRERFAALQRFAEGRHKPWQDFDTQVDFAAQEMQAKIPWTKTQKDFSRAGEWGHRYEGYATNTEGDRVRAGRGFLEDYRQRRAAALPPTEGGGFGAGWNSAHPHGSVDPDWQNHRGGKVPMPEGMPKPDPNLHLYPQRKANDALTPPSGMIGLRRAVGLTPPDAGGLGGARAEAQHVHVEIHDRGTNNRIMVKKSLGKHAPKIKRYSVQNAHADHHGVDS